MTLNALEPVAGVAPPAPTLGAAAPAVPFEPRTRRWSRDEYYEASRKGWFRGQRVLLLDGEVIEMAAQGNWHVVVVGKAQDALVPVFPREQYWTRVQNPLDAPDHSEPEPDIAVVPGRPDDYTAHPKTALLIVEVADSSLRLDRKKANAYAAAGVPDYWIVDIGGHQVEVYREPVADPREPFGFRYASVVTLRPGASISPVAAPQATVAVADLLPKQPVPNPDA